MHIKDAQEQIEVLQASESIKHANLQELARLVLAYDENQRQWTIEELTAHYDAMINFAKGVAQ